MNRIFQSYSSILVLKGVDTICSIYVNDQLVGTTNSMFREYNFDIKSSTVQGQNKLAAVFTSPIEYAKTKYELYQQEKGYDVPPICQTTVQNVACHLNFFQKMQSSFI